ncbi:efflux RND transporter periplasmic adaptor subunit [Oryzifoliimicrobium ureilyticus]|uniref:efflux RND transporter periplasmic adaptor subunit n=1 Tax=Oryzifoliimicrobium ureilyticus TaxID=3113724 RepID=UPI0030766B43
MGRRKAVFFVGIIVIAGLAYATRQSWLPPLQSKWANHERQDDRRDAKDQAIPVIAAPVATSDVPVYVNGIGSVKALNTVVVRAQVTGKITAIDFDEGEDIKKGSRIAKLDDALYKAQLDQAIAKKAQDEALLANAQLELSRLERLAQNAAGTQQQVDNQRSLVSQYSAQIQSDQGAIEAAQAQLDYTTITAPIDGRTGIRAVDIGNIVSSSDTNGIVTLSQIQPINVIFAIPQQSLAQVNEAVTAGDVQVEALSGDGKTVIDTGKLTVVDNQVDPTTGTVKLKAEFHNQKLVLWPGAFVNARLLASTMKNVLTVPSAAVQRGPGGTYAYIVEPDQTVKMQAIKLAMQDDKISVVTEGLKADDKVVTTGFARLQDGTAVKVSSQEEADPSKLPVPLADESQSRRQRRQGGGEGGQHRQGQERGGHRQNGASAEKPADQPATTPSTNPPAKADGATQ